MLTYSYFYCSLLFSYFFLSAYLFFYVINQLIIRSILTLSLQLDISLTDYYLYRRSKNYVLNERIELNQYCICFYLDPVASYHGEFFSQDDSLAGWDGLIVKENRISSSLCELWARHRPRGYSAGKFIHTLHGQSYSEGFALSPERALRKTVQQIHSVSLACSVYVSTLILCGLMWVACIKVDAKPLTGRRLYFACHSAHT